MKRYGRPVALLLGGIAIAFLTTACGRDTPATRRTNPERLRPTPATAIETRPAGRPVPEGDEAALAEARSFLAAPARSETCGPYRLVSDADDRLVSTLRAICAGPIATFDSIYAERLSVTPAHPPRGTLVLFADPGRFRAYVAARADLPQGYAGFSLATRGLVVLPAAGVTADELARTLTHELAHLAHRRTFGADLDRWLAEGLADAVSDTAHAGGQAPLTGFAGVEGLRVRLLGGYATGRARPLHELAALPEGEFDRGRVSHDYEQSALLVRFLLLDPELGPLLRGWLAARALQGGGIDSRFPPDRRPDWDEIDRRFRRWLGAPEPDAASHR